MRRHDPLFARSLVVLLGIGILAACGTSAEGTGDKGGDDTGTEPGDDTPTTTGEGGAGDDDDTASDAAITPPSKDAGTDATASGTACVKADDCPSKVCDLALGICLPAGPKDGVENADETDIDCGGAVAEKCDTNKKCLVNADCLNAGACADVGTGLKCQAPSPTDAIKNNGETDVDCGGPKAPACPNLGQACLVKTDCVTVVCTAGACAVPAPDDGEQNNGETDVDCGGPNAAPCADNLMCAGSTDCTSKVCADAAGTLRCSPPSDSDGVQNGTETALDCGGGNKGCAAGLTCNVGSDCASQGCDANGLCAVGRSCVGHYGGDTCGLGGAGGRGAAQWESCCATADVTSADDGVVHLDKYQVTAGRMRAFLESDEVRYNVRGFVQAARAAGKIPQLVTGSAANKTHTVLDAEWDDYLPTSFAGDQGAGELSDCEQGAWDDRYKTCCETVTKAAAAACPTGSDVATTSDSNPTVINTVCHYWNPATSTCYQNRTGKTPGLYTAVATHLGGSVFHSNSQSSTGCFPGAPGTHAFRFPDNVNNADGAEYGQDVYDTKAMNCVDYLVGQAFCVWDGGRLETTNEWLGMWAGVAAGTHAEAADDNPPDGNLNATNPPWYNTAALDPKKQQSGTYFGNRFPSASDASLQASMPSCPAATPNCTAGFPLFPSATQSIEYANWRYSYEYPNLKSGDFIVFISAPGRTKGRGPLGHADVIGNVFELTSTVTYNAANAKVGTVEALPSVNRSTHNWSGNGSWEVHNYNRAANGSSMLLNKYGKLGLRCAHK